MNFVKSEESAKAAKLLGAIVVVFGCAAWRVVGAVSPPAAPAQAAPTQETAVASDAPVAATPEEGMIELPKALIPSNVDPFRTIALTRSGPAPATTPPTLAGNPVGPLAVLPLPTAQGAASLPTVPSAAPAVPKPSLRLTGTLAGPNATAILELGGVSQVVRVGVRLDDGTKVVAIDPATITVLRDGKPLTLEVGG